ncbi:MAG: hypothetical protein AAF561_05475 [Planctomycetota bacterium]
MRMPPEDVEIKRQVSPIYPLLTDLIQQTCQQVRELEAQHNPPKKTERANVLHWFIRSNLQRAFDAADLDDLEQLQLNDAPDGDGLDYLLLNFGTPIILRWHRLGADGKIRRNDTTRSNRWLDPGPYLPGSEEFRLAAAACEGMHPGIQKVTLTLRMEEGPTIMGQPQWWLRSMNLVREFDAAYRTIDYVARYNVPTPEEFDVPTTPPFPELRVRQEEQEERWAEQLKAAI